MKKKAEKPKSGAKPKTFKIKGAFSDAILISVGKTPKSGVTFSSTQK